jgi:predicted aspartyl protease
LDNFLILEFKHSKAIRIKCTLYSDDKTQSEIITLIYDTGADKTAITLETLEGLGYTNFKKSDVVKNTATGPVKLDACQVSELIIGSQQRDGFIRKEFTVDVMETKKSSAFDGVLGMDFISLVESVISGKDKKLTITLN